jgi:hypothetical protein
MHLVDIMGRVSLLGEKRFRRILDEVRGLQEAVNRGAVAALEGRGAV